MKRELTPKQVRAAEARAQRQPDRTLMALALLGAALSAYLTATAWLGTPPAYCGTGSDCDLVQASRWAWLLGFPVAFWGLGAFASLFVIARIRKPDVRWAWAWLLSGVGLAISLYLTAVSLVVLEASCLYCLSSFGLMAAIFVVVALRRPEMPDFSWPSWLVQSGGAALAAVFAFHVYHAGLALTPPPEDPYLRALATHLTRTGARFYGASWCPHCIRQKEMFGASASRLPYVECSPWGRTGPQSPACSRAGVRSYPTWSIDGERYVEEIAPDRLAELTRFEWERGARAR